MRIDNVGTADPFGKRRVGSRDRSVGQAVAADERELVLREALELAHGRRHLTVVHGDPGDVVASRHLSAFYEELRRLAAGCDWVRVRGDAVYVTVTVGGGLADDRIALFEAAAACANPGGWLIVASAVPPFR